MPVWVFFMIENFFNNPWTVGIGGSIVSGIIVWFVTTKLLIRKVNTEYLRKIDQANNEILYSIRPSIAGKTFPSYNIVDAIRLATAKKYDIQEKEVISIGKLGNILIKEVMDNSFLSPEQKNDLCKELLTFQEPQKKKKESQKENNEQSKQKYYSTDLLAMTLGIFTSIASLMFIFKSASTGIKDYSSTFFVFLLPFFAIFIGIFSYILNQYLVQKRKITKVKKILGEMDQILKNDVVSNKE